MHWPGSGRNRVEETVNQNKRFVEGQWKDVVVFCALCLFILSPLIQVVREIVAPHKETIFGPIRTYPFTIGVINLIAALVAAVMWLILVMTTVRRIRMKEKTAIFVPLLIFGTLVAWMYLSQAINGFTEYSSVGDPYRNESLFTFILYLLGYFFLGTILKSDRLRRLLVLVFLTSNLIMGVLVLIDSYAISFDFFRDSEGMAAIFHQFNHYGYYLLFGVLLSGILFVVYDGNTLLRIFCAVVFVVDNVILILNNTFGCYLAVAAALAFGTIIVIAMRRKRNEVIRMVAVVLAFIAITCVMRMLDLGNAHDMTKLVDDIGNIATESDQAKYAGTGRWALWKHTMDYISEKPVFGWGVEGITERLGTEIDTINDRPHNEYLQWAAFFGIPAAILYLAGLCVIMFGMFPRIRKIDSVSFACFVASAGYIASAFVGNTMYYTAPFFFIFMGMTCKERFYNRKTDKKSDVNTDTEQQETV